MLDFPKDLMIYIYSRYEEISKTTILLFSWPPVREVCLNYEVVMFQPCTGTPQYLLYITNMLQTSPSAT